MKTDQILPAKKLGALLCAALVLVFMQAAVASTVGSVQHLVGAHHHHQHMLFADVILDFDHADHGHDGAHHDHDVGHHHRGDLGSANLLLASPSPNFVSTWKPAEPPARDRLIIAFRQSLPERPPRTSSSA